MTPSIFLATTSGGYLIWLLYGLGIGSMPLIVADAVGLARSLVAVAVAFRLCVWVAHPGGRRVLMLLPRA